MLKQSISEFYKKLKLNNNARYIANNIRVESKKAIALSRRDNFNDVKDLFRSINNNFKDFNKFAKQEPSVIYEGFYSEAVEEYIEAVYFYEFLNKNKVDIPKYIKTTPEQVIAGVCDFTGELVRKAVNMATQENMHQLEKFYKAIENIAEDLTSIAFRGKLRQKYDEVERNLKRLEQILYDIRLKR
ncbi:MAG: hypothetical protein ABIF17_00225 [Patescibacteria group bacterium]